MKLIITADEFGRSKGITDTILECADNGLLNSVDIVPSGYAFGYAIDQYKRRKRLRLAVHLDLSEGKPLTNPEEISFLVNDKGRLNNSFVSLWLKYLFNLSARREIKNQVKLELKAQIKKVRKSIGPKYPLLVDSHNHIHMIPFVFDVLLEINDETSLSYIRLCNEPFFVCLDGLVSIFNYFGLNIIKHILLRYLSLKYVKILLKKKIKYSKYFIGVLFTGNNSSVSVNAALSKICAVKRDENVEILFHPGLANSDERKYWRGDKMRLKYYFSINRKNESETLRSEGFRRVIGDFKERIG